MNIYDSVYSVILCFTFVSTEDVSLEFVKLDGAGVVRVNDLEEWVDEFSLNRNSQFSNQISDLINGESFSSIQIKVIEDFLQQVLIILS